MPNAKRKFQKVILHFGGDKTGSTAIQVALDSKRQFLLETSLVAYPPGVWHAELGSFFCDAPELYVYNAEASNRDVDSIKVRDARYMDALEEWLHNAPSCESLVFSYEGFLDLDESALKRLKVFCDRFSDEVLIILYARSPISYAVSAMSQRVKTGRKAWGDILPISPYRFFLERVLNVFERSKVFVKNFSKSTLKNGDVVEDFFEFVLPGNSLIELSSDDVVANGSISWTAMQFGEKIVESLANHRVVLSENIFFQRYAKYLSEIQGGKIQLTDSQITLIERHARQHTKYLKEKFGLDFFEDSEQYRLTSDFKNDQNLLLQTCADMLADTIAVRSSVANITNASGRLKLNVEISKLVASTAFKFLAYLKNESDQVWISTTTNPIRLSYRWIGLEGQDFPQERARSVLPINEICPGQEIIVNMHVLVPSVPGRYRLELLPLQEMLFWFDERGFNKYCFDLDVVAETRF